MRDHVHHFYWPNQDDISLVLDYFPSVGALISLVGHVRALMVFLFHSKDSRVGVIALVQW